jgi:hypothetical protein
MPLSERNSDKIYMLGPRIAASQKVKETAAMRRPLLNREPLRDLIRLAGQVREMVMTLRHSACAAALLLVLSSQGVSAQPTKPAGQCFFTGQFENWRAPDARTINIRVRGNQYYRLGLGNTCPALLDPGARLVTAFRGASTICSPLDWDLKVSAGIGSPATPCLVRTMTHLTPEEAKALTAKERP